VVLVSAVFEPEFNDRFVLPFLDDIGEVLSGRESVGPI
jgi:hypothetical protein